jgi:hypothetical protein
MLDRRRSSLANGMRDLKKEKHWQEIIDRQIESGKSQAQFCKDEGLNVNQFYSWKGVLIKRQKIKRQPKPLEDKMPLPFVALKVPDIDFSSKRDSVEQIEISKIVFRISAGTDKAALACILQSLEKA